MAMIEVQMGCYIEIMSTMWLDYVKARLLVEDAVATGQVLTSLHSSVTGPALNSDQWWGQENLVSEFMSKARPFVEKNSFHHKSLKEFLENPAKLFSQTFTTT